MKIYVHHWFTDELFIKLAHNTTNRVYKLNHYNGQRIGKVLCKYNDIDFEFIFNPDFNDNSDGYHLIDFFTALRKKDFYDYYKDIDVSNEILDIPFIKRFKILLENKKGWLITIFRTEKLLDTYDTNDEFVSILENEIVKLNKHIIITDNFFIEERLKFTYPNIHFSLTNTIWQWNELINIRYWYEFSKIYEKLNFEYKLMYSIRRHKLYRVNIIKNLAKLNRKDIFLQRANFYVNGVYDKYDTELSIIPNINLNTLEGSTDFQNLKLLDYEMGVEYDVFFRFLNLSKMQILDESWSWFKGDFTSQYLSEKSFGLILAKIPFISTHSYPLDIIQKSLNIRQHPFYDDFKNHKGDAEKFTDFVVRFMNDFESNYILCKEWIDECHLLLIERMENENSLLELMNKGFKNSSKLLL
jgi:hypothetical protein